MVTVPGAGSTVVTFSINNSAGGNYATDFANAIATATSVVTLPSESGVAGGVNELIDASATGSAVLTTGNQYTLIETFAPYLLQLNASNETVLGGSDLTVQELSNVGGEKVSFISGSNVFEGALAGVGGDTISGGTGSDTILTGGGPTTVFGGTASSITLSDSTVGHGDVVVLQTGSSTVTAGGLSDTVFASATGSIIGGSGNLYLTTDGGTVSVTGGSGSFFSFLSAGTDLTVTSGFGSEYIQTGAGSETINAGTGSAAFEIASVSGGGPITINDFGASDFVNFAGLSTTAESNLGSTVTASSITVTLGNGTTVDFVGITSLSGHEY
jgi:hypothetical protein